MDPQTPLTAYGEQDAVLAFRSMPSGLRVTRIDRAPATGTLDLWVNGKAIAGLLHRTFIELTVASGDVLMEVGGTGRAPLAHVITVAPGLTAPVLLGRRLSLGIAEASHYLQLETPQVGLPDRTLYPLNLAGHSAQEWLQQKQALGEPLSIAQATYLQSQLAREIARQSTLGEAVPSLAELGAFAALGLDIDAQEADVREAFRLLVSIHTPETGADTRTMRRLEEAFRIAMEVLSHRVSPGVSEIGR